MILKTKGILYVLLLLLFASCGHRNNKEVVVAPWGNDMGDSIVATDFDLSFIQTSGELIMLTISGPDSYYDYHGRNLGLQYLLCQRYAKSIGVRLRVELCKDTTELLRKLSSGEGDVAAMMIGKDKGGGLLFCGPSADTLSRQWVVSEDKPRLAQSIDQWFKPHYVDIVKSEEDYYLSNRSIKRHVYAPMMNKSKGVISKYDNLFIKYSRRIGWDWRLMAAQCYQESTFDPKAKSWAGACGLMQIMPSTAEVLGLPESKIFDPESNVAAAAKYLAQLEGKFKDIPNRHERLNFILASYNGGIHHIRDAMRLAECHGKNHKIWREVEPFVLMLSVPKGYQHPVVEYGYMRGGETVDYVSRIKSRWNSYRGVKSVRGVDWNMQPVRAKKSKEKYSV